MEPHWLWWSRQPEVIAAEVAQRQLAWKISKTESRIAREAEKLQRAGLSDRDINRLKRLAGVTREDITRDPSKGH